MRNRKRIYLLLILSLLFVTLAAAGAADAAVSSSDETQNMDIRTVGDLRDFRDKVNSGEAVNGNLTGDIDLEGEEWTPIGNGTYPYENGFDGNGYTISNFKVTGTDGAAHELLGLFGETHGWVRNLHVEKADISGGLGAYAGVIAGISHGRVINCTITDSSVSGGERSSVGGFVGENRGEITGCSITDSSVATEDSGVAGGIAGYHYGKISGCAITDSSVASGVDGTAGCLVGFSGSNSAVSDSTISGCSVQLGASSRAGGAVGLIRPGDDEDDDGEIGLSNIVVEGLIFTFAEDCHAGGLVGEIYPGSGAGAPIFIGNAVISDMLVDAPEDNIWFGGVIGATEGSDESQVTIANVVLFDNTITLSGSSSLAGLIAGMLYNADVDDCAAARGQLDGDALVGTGDIDEDGVLFFDADDLGSDLLPMLMALLNEDTYMTVPKGERVVLEIEPLPGTQGVTANMFSWASSSPDIVEITQTETDGMSITFYAKEAGESTVTCTIDATLLKMTLTCHVTVTDDGSGWSGSNSNCNTLGFGIAGLALLPMLRKRRK